MLGKGKHNVLARASSCHQACIRLVHTKGLPFPALMGVGVGRELWTGGSLPPRAFLRNLKNQLQRQTWTSLQNYQLGEYLKTWRHRLDSIQFCVERNQAFTQRDKGQRYRRKPGICLCLGIWEAWPQRRWKHPERGLTWFRGLCWEYAL